MKYTPPPGSTDPNAPYTNGNKAQGIKGSPVAAEAVENPQREIVAAIAATNQEPTNDDNAQLLEGMRRYGAGFDWSPLQKKYVAGKSVVVGSDGKHYKSLLDSGVDTAAGVKDPSGGANAEYWEIFGESSTPFSSGGYVTVILENSGDWTVPIDALYTVKCIGGGGGGGRASTGNLATDVALYNGAGGGQALPVSFSIRLNKGFVVPVVIGAGGLGETKTTDGTSGGDTSFGTYGTSFGGTAPISQTISKYANQGGMFGGQSANLSAGATNSAGASGAIGTDGFGGGGGGGTKATKQSDLNARGGLGGYKAENGKVYTEGFAGGNGGQGAIIITYFDPTL